MKAVIETIRTYTKKALNKVLSLFPIPKIRPELINIEKQINEMALIGEREHEKDVLPESCVALLDIFKNVPYPRIFIDGKEIKIKQPRREGTNGNNKNIHKY